MVTIRNDGFNAEWLRVHFCRHGDSVRGQDVFADQNDMTVECLTEVPAS